MKRAQCHARTGDTDMYRDEDIPEDDMATMPAYDSYVNDQMRKPQYRRIKIGLDRVERIIGSIASGCQHTSREQTLKELDYVLGKLQEIERLAEKIEDSLVWEYVLDHIDLLVAIRRHMVAEIRWELQSDLNCPVEA